MTMNCNIHYLDVQAET